MHTNHLPRESRDRPYRKLKLLPSNGGKKTEPRLSGNTDQPLEPPRAAVTVAGSLCSAPDSISAVWILGKFVSF